MSFDAKHVLENEKEIDIEKYGLTTFEYESDFHLRAPIIIFLEVTRNCNLKCRHCFVGESPSLNDELTKSEIFDLLDQIKKMKISLLHITGGEPFMNKDIVEILNQAKKLVPFVQVVTNGTLITDDVLEQIDRRVGFVVSLDGVKNSNLRNVSFDLLAERVLSLKNRHFPVQCWFCPTRYNIDDFDYVASWCREHGIILADNTLLPIGRAKDNPDIFLTEDDLNKFMMLYVKRTLDGSVNFVKNLDQKDFDKMQARATGKIKDRRAFDAFQLAYRLEAALGMCKGGRSFAHIAANGDVYPCSNCAVEELFKAGNIRENNFLDIWNNSFKDIRGIRYSDFKRCENCELNKLLPNCKLRCPPLSKALYNDLTYCGGTDIKIKSLIEKMKFRKKLQQILIESKDVLEYRESITKFRDQLYQELYSKNMRVCIK